MLKYKITGVRTIGMISGSVIDVTLQEEQHNIRPQFIAVWLDGCIHPILGHSSICCTGQVLKEAGRLSLSFSLPFVWVVQEGNDNRTPWSERGQRGDLMAAIDPQMRRCCSVPL